MYLHYADICLQVHNQAGTTKYKWGQVVWYSYLENPDSKLISMRNCILVGLKKKKGTVKLWDDLRRGFTADIKSITHPLPKDKWLAWFKSEETIKVFQDQVPLS